MANTLGVYNPLFYAQEALIHLQNALGMANRVHRGFEEERKAFGKGETVNIRKPSTFTAQDAPSTAQDLLTETVPLTLAHWKEVKFKLTDRELTISDKRIISEHIQPAAYALANDVDSKLAALYADIPWIYDTTGDPGTAPVVGDITNGHKILFNNGVPMTPGMIHMMIDGTLQAGFLGLSAFAQWQGAGQAGVDTQLSGSLGTRFGVELFANQNVQLHVPGTATDVAGTVTTTGSGTINDNSAEKGSTVMSVSTLGADATTYKKGDTFVIAGNTQRYAITANAAVTSNVAIISFTPALVQDYAATTVVTFTVGAGTNKWENLMFHRNAFALCMVPLTDMASALGAQIATVSDPVTGLAIRSRVYYIGTTSTVEVALDILYGVKTLDPNLAVRAREDIS